MNTLAGEKFKVDECIWFGLALFLCFTRLIRVVKSILISAMLNVVQRKCYINSKKGTSQSWDSEPRIWISHWCGHWKKKNVDCRFTEGHPVFDMDFWCRIWAPCYPYWLVIERQCMDTIWHGSSSGKPQSGCRLSRVLKKKKTCQRWGGMVV